MLPPLIRSIFATVAMGLWLWLAFLLSEGWVLTGVPIRLWSSFLAFIYCFALSILMIYGIAYDDTCLLQFRSCKGIFLLLGHGTRLIAKDTSRKIAAWLHAVTEEGINAQSTPIWTGGVFATNSYYCRMARKWFAWFTA
jgi:hypothetical protein